MLDPDQMTPDTLMANINLYHAVKRTQPDDFTPEDHARLDALTMERDRRIQQADDLEDGLWISRVWAHEPHQSLMWRRSNGKWERVTSASEHHETSDKPISDPQTFYGICWKKQIVRLVAVTA